MSRTLHAGHVAMARKAGFLTNGSDPPTSSSPAVHRLLTADILVRALMPGAHVFGLPEARRCRQRARLLTAIYERSWQAHKPNDWGLSVLPTCDILTMNKQIHEARAVGGGQLMALELANRRLGDLRQLGLPPSIRNCASKPPASQKQPASSADTSMGQKSGLPV